jgi:hypothetical protein
MNSKFFLVRVRLKWVVGLHLGCGQPDGARALSISGVHY